MKLTFEVDTDSPTALGDIYELAKALDNWSRITGNDNGKTEDRIEEPEKPKKKRAPRKKAEPVAEPAAPVAEAEPVAEPPASVEGAEATKDAVSAAITALIQVKGKPVARELLAGLDAIDPKGLPRISCIKEARYGEAIARAQELANG